MVYNDSRDKVCDKGCAQRSLKHVDYSLDFEEITQLKERKHAVKLN